MRRSFGFGVVVALCFSLPARAAGFSRLDSLFIVAATGEPRFARERDSCQKVLIGLDTATLDYLLRNRLTGQTPRQRHYVETLFAAISDSGRHAASRERLAAALRTAPDSLRAQLLYIGSRLEDAAFRNLAIPFLHADSQGVRRMANRCLGAYPQRGNDSLLWDGLEKTRGLELQERLWALQAQGRVKDWRRLVPLLRDSLYCNRQAVRDMMLFSVDSSWKRLRDAVPLFLDDADRREWCLLALDAKGSGGFLAREWPRLTEAERKLFAAYRKPAKRRMVK